MITPDGTVFTTGGNSGYRGRGAGGILKAQFYDPAKNGFTPAADPTVGRKQSHRGPAARRPRRRLRLRPALRRQGRLPRRPLRTARRGLLAALPLPGRQPRLQLGRETDVERGAQITLRSSAAARIRTRRLMRPGSATHVTDFGQRSVALDVEKRADGSLTEHVPDDPSLVPSGWNMPFVTDRQGVPSKASWVHVRW